MFRCHWMTFGIFLLATLPGGCRRVYTFVPIEGTITQHGQPLAGVQVVFFADPDAGTEGPRSSGITDEAGHYRLRTGDGKDGAVVGQHRVCVIELPAEGTLRSNPRLGKAVSSKVVKELGLETNKEPAKPKFPAIYSQIYETPLRAEVRPGGTQTFDFDIP